MTPASNWFRKPVLRDEVSGRQLLNKDRKRPRRSSHSVNVVTGPLSRVRLQQSCELTGARIRGGGPVRWDCTGTRLAGSGFVHI